MKAIKTPKGFLAIQGDQLWFQAEPNGWAVTSDDENHLRLAAAHFEITDYTIVTITK